MSFTVASMFVTIAVTFIMVAYPCWRRKWTRLVEEMETEGGSPHPDEGLLPSVVIGSSCRQTPLPFCRHLPIKHEANGDYTTLWVCACMCVCVHVCACMHTDLKY